MKVNNLFPSIEKSLSKLDTADPKALKRMRVKLEKKCAEINDADPDPVDELILRKWVSWAESKILWIKYMERDF